MTDLHRLTIGSAGTVGTWLVQKLDAIGPHAATLSALATGVFMLTCIAEKFGVLPRFRSRQQNKDKE